MVWVEDHVTRNFEKVRVFLYQDRLVPPLKDVFYPIVNAVEPLRVYAIELVHALCQIAVRRFYKKMVMLVIRQ